MITSKSAGGCGGGEASAGTKEESIDNAATAEMMS
jgi:hypothetical protein